MKDNKKTLLRRIAGASTIILAATLVTVAYAQSPSSSSTRTFEKPREAVARTPPTVVRLAEAPRASGSPRKAVTKTRGGKTIEGVVNINTATTSELQRLPGIGLAKAERIVQWRKHNGKFHRVVDLRRVKGFGPKSVKKLSPHLSISGSTTLGAK